jgi:hypothetical protein
VTSVQWPGSPWSAKWTVNGFCSGLECICSGLECREQCRNDENMTTTYHVRGGTSDNVLRPDQCTAQRNGLIMGSVAKNGVPCTRQRSCSAIERAVVVSKISLETVKLTLAWMSRLNGHAHANAMLFSPQIIVSIKLRHRKTHQPNDSSPSIPLASGVCMCM